MFNQLVINHNGSPATTSRLIAQTFRKEHKNVLSAVKSLECSEGFNRLNFKPIEFTDSRGRKQPEFIITRDGFTFLAMGFTGKEAARFKEDFINAFNKMEALLKNGRPSESRLPDFSNPASAARAWAEQYEQRQAAEAKLIETERAVSDLAPRAEYADKVLLSKTAMTTTQIAKELGMSAFSLNKSLHEMRVQYRLKNGTWVLYADYVGDGLAETRTHSIDRFDGSTETKSYLVWTESGRNFLHQLFNPKLSAVKSYE